MPSRLTGGAAGTHSDAVVEIKGVVVFFESNQSMADTFGFWGVFPKVTQTAGDETCARKRFFDRKGVVVEVLLFVVDLNSESSGFSTKVVNPLGLGVVRSVVVVGLNEGNTVAFSNTLNRDRSR